MSEIRVDVYVGSSKEALWDLGQQIGLTGEAAEMFRYLALDVKLTYMVDSATGIGRLIEADGRPLS